MAGQFSNGKGFTIMEVLVGAFVFIVGFNVVILALSGTLVRLSTGEMAAVGGLAQEFVERAVAQADTLPLDTLVHRSGRIFRVRRFVHVDTGLAQARLQINRPRQERLLVDIYYEHPAAR